MEIKLSTEYTKKEIDELTSRLRVCDICHRGYFEGQQCPFYEIHLREEFRPLITDSISVKDFSKVKIKGVSTRVKKKIIKIKYKKKLCEVCEKEFRGKGYTCSPLCTVRSYSITYTEKGKEIGMSLEKGIEQLEKQTGKKYVDNQLI